MNILRAVSLTILLTLWAAAARADSPITSTDFHTAYLDVALVERAAARGVMDGQIAAFLSGPDNPLDVKAAVINALGWKFEGKNNAELYGWYLAAKYGLRIDNLNLDVINDGELFSLAYLTVMDDYFTPQKAIPLIDAAWERSAARSRKRGGPGFTVSLIRALIHAQAAMESDWCAVWTLTENAMEADARKRDMRAAAVDIITGYMGLYRGDCQ